MDALGLYEFLRSRDILMYWEELENGNKHTHVEKSSMLDKQGDKWGRLQFLLNFHFNEQSLKNHSHLQRILDTHNPSFVSAEFLYTYLN